MTNKKEQKNTKIQNQSNQNNIKKETEKYAEVNIMMLLTYYLATA